MELVGRQVVLAQIKVTQAADDFTFAKALGDWHARVRDDDALIGVAIESTVTGAIRRIKRAVSKSELAEAHTERNRRQMRGPDLAQLVEQGLVMQDGVF